MVPKVKRGGKCFKMDYPLEKSAGMVYNKEVDEENAKTAAFSCLKTRVTAIGRLPGTIRESCNDNYSAYPPRTERGES